MQNFRTLGQPRLGAKVNTGEREERGGARERKNAINVHPSHGSSHQMLKYISACRSGFI
jgi:hypothetical protein